VKVEPTALDGVLLLQPDVHRDDRGEFFEAWHHDRYAGQGLPGDFVQDNFSFSKKGVLRGLHFQHPRPQGKLISVLEGEVYDVAVDIRVGSPGFGRWVGVTLSAANRRQVWIPPGFAHGFCVTSDGATVGYKCTDVYVPGAEACLIWNDARLAIRWPAERPVISAKDLAGRPLDELARAGALPLFAARTS
jgi:dTDP-4-dehydrorhamnose 3,5-epimerase